MDAHNASRFHTLLSRIDDAVARATTTTFDDVVREIDTLASEAQQVLSQCGVADISFGASILERKLHLAIKANASIDCCKRLLNHRLCLSRNDIVSIVGLYCLLCKYLISIGELAEAEILYSNLRHLVDDYSRSATEMQAILEKRWTDLVAGRR